MITAVSPISAAAAEVISFARGLPPEGPTDLAITAHRLALQALERSVNSADHMHPTYSAAGVRQYRACERRERAAFLHLLALPAGSSDDVRAKSRHLAWFARRGGTLDSDQLIALLGSFDQPNATQAATRSSADSGRPNDRDLVAMGAEFERRLARQREAGRKRGPGLEFEACYSETDAVVRQILATPAHTLEGLQLKARAIQWCHAGRFSGFDDGDTTDLRLAASIVRDLLAGGRE